MKIQNREKRKIHRFEKRAGWKDDHHINKPCSRGGETISSNLILMDAYRHDAWHLVFGNQTLREIIDLLKSYLEVNHFLHTVNNYYKYQAYRLLFGKMKIFEVIELLERVQSLKYKQRIKFKFAA